MNTKELEKIKKFGNGVSLLIVDDDHIAVDIHKDALEDFVSHIDVAYDGKEALEMIEQRNNGYDLIITDILMPELDGFELIKKIRKKSVKQRFIVMTSLSDMNEMRDIINLGTDGIISKPYGKDKFLDIISRVFQAIYHDKLIRTQIRQLLMLSKENIDLKSKALEQSHKTKQIPTRVPTIQKTTMSTESLKEQKYDLRKTLEGESSEKLLEELDYVHIDKIDAVQNNLMDYEAMLCKASGQKDAELILKTLRTVADGLGDFVQSLNNMGKFPVAANAAEHFRGFLYNLESKELEDEDKTELVIDSLVYMLQDINDWIIAVFVNKTADNINYFDASFANSCLEIETIFKENIFHENDDDGLEFF